MSLEQLENEWRLRKQGRRKEVIVVSTLGAVAALVLLYLAWAFWLS